MHDADKRWWGWESEAARLREIERTKRRVGWFHWAALSALIILAVGIGNAPHTAVEAPVVDGRLLQEYKIRLETANKMIVDYKKQAEVAKGLLKVSLANEAKLTDQLKALSASVPSQPVILQAIQKEAVTEKGLRQVVARNFGKDIAAHIQITGGE